MMIIIIILLIIILKKQQTVLPPPPNALHRPRTGKNTLLEMRKKVIAINKMADDKSFGFHGITGEDIKAAGEFGIDIQYRLCQRIWTHKTVSDD